MRIVYETDVNGKKWPCRVPETEEERRQLQRETSQGAVGGIDDRDDWEADDDDFSDD